MLRSILGACFGTGARVTPRLKYGILTVRLYSAINVVNLPLEEVMKKIKNDKKWNNIHDSNPYIVPNISDDFLL